MARLTLKSWLEQITAAKNNLPRLQCVTKRPGLISTTFYRRTVFFLSTSYFEKILVFKEQGLIGKWAAKNSMRAMEKSYT